MNFNLIAKKLFGKRYSEGFCYKGKTKLKCGRQNGRQKQGFLSKKRVFDRINLSNMQKNQVFIRSFRINTRFWGGRQELKTYDDKKKALIFKAFLLLNANVDARIFLEIIVILWSICREIRLLNQKVFHWLSFR